MLVRVKDSLKKVNDILVKTPNYMPAAALAESCGMSVASVYKAIRLLREKGIGVIATPNGYILSEFATKQDDVHFLRRMNGRRTSDFIAVRAAENDIRKRWSSHNDKRELQLVMQPLTSNLGVLNQGMKVLISKKNSKGL